MPSLETIQQELGKAQSIDDFFGKEGIFARLFAETLEQMLDAELTAQLGYEPYEAKGRNSGNSRNGHYRKTVRTSNGETEVTVPRDRNGAFEPTILKKYQANTNELEDKIIAMYARGMTQRDIEAQLAEMYGIEVSAQMISTITDKVRPQVEAWQSRPLAALYPMIYLDALHYKLRKDHKIANRAIYIVLAVDLEGYKDVLGHWVSDGEEGASFWLSVVTDLKNRGVEDVFIACVDGLKGFKQAIQSVFPQVAIQRCIIHQIRNSLKYVVWKDRKAFTQDLKAIYRAPTRELAETHLLQLAEKWGDKYAIAVRSWQTHWDQLATLFDYTPEIRRLIYTTNVIEAYNRQLRKVTKNRGALPSPEAIRKLLWLAHQDIAKKWTMPIANWAIILNQLAIRFEDRFPI
ncbi:MAG: IS256 family transposase [Shimia sp.]|nr:IS256 family transposase [Shimia sp.]